MMSAFSVQLLLWGNYFFRKSNFSKHVAAFFFFRMATLTEGVYFFMAHYFRLNDGIFRKAFENRAKEIRSLCCSKMLNNSLLKIVEN